MPFIYINGVVFIVGYPPIDNGRGVQNSQRPGVGVWGV